jgi:uncharacterized protein YbjT (DUF2867 family)
MADLAITGATGHIGRLVAARLAARNVPLRLVVRDTSRAADLPPAEIRQASSYADTAAMRAALEGIHTVFLISGDLTLDRVAQHKSAVDAAVQAGVQRIVYLSFLGASPEAVFLAAREHYQTEEYIRATELPFTFLRNSLYMDHLPHWFGADGAIRGPAGNGRCAWVTCDDIADVAANVLTSDGHDGATYTNTGREAFTMSEAAERIGQFIGRPFTYIDETHEEAVQSRAKYGAPDWLVEDWISSYTAIAAGEMDTVTDAVLNVTGHAPQTLEDYLRRHPESYAHLLNA